MEVHPAAELFPLMQGQEFDELVEDIRANGLREPGKVAGGLLLDGRNRQRACEVAGVPFETVEVDLNGDNPVVYVVSLNVKRRNLTAGQRAIAAAEAWDLAPKYLGDAKGTAGVLASLFGTSHAYVTQARALVERDRLAADAVKAGSKSLATAHAELRDRELALQSDEEKLRWLRAARPDLAERVEAGTLSLDEANTIADQEAQREREQAATAGSMLARAVRVLADRPDNAPALVDRLERHGIDVDVTPDACETAVEYLHALAARLRRDTK